MAKATAPRPMPNARPAAGEIRPEGIGRSLVRDIVESMSRSNHMLIALAPPAMQYPASATQKSWPSVGRPAGVMNIGASVVTSRSEMMRGLVSVMRSATRDGRR